MWALTLALHTTLLCPGTTDAQQPQTEAPQTEAPQTAAPRTEAPQIEVDGFVFTTQPWYRSLQDAPSLPPLMSKTWSLAVTGAAYAAVNTWTYFAWYRKRALSDRFAWNDEGWFGADTYAGGSDKLGHMWGAYAVQRIIANVLKSGGWTRGTSNLIGAGAIMSYLTFIEFKDAYHTGYGFSVSDMVANLVGTGLGVVMDVHPRFDQMFDFRLEYFPSREYWDLLVDEGVVNAGEDYSGQTYILAYHFASLRSLQRSDAWGLLRALDVTVAYGTDNYLPRPRGEDTLATRSLSLGLALNVQYLIDRLFGSSQPTHYGHATAQLVADMLAVPYTNFAILERSRSSNVDVDH